MAGAGRGSWGHTGGRRLWHSAAPAGRHTGGCCKYKLKNFQGATHTLRNDCHCILQARPPIVLAVLLSAYRTTLQHFLRLVHVCFGEHCLCCRPCSNVCAIAATRRGRGAAAARIAAGNCSCHCNLLLGLAAAKKVPKKETLQLEAQSLLTCLCALSASRYASKVSLGMGPIGTTTCSWSGREAATVNCF